MGPTGMSIQKAYGLYREGKILVNRKYQRKLVWAEQEKIDLIDTIMRDYPIPLILLAERPSLHGPGKYEILDGVQRLNAIFSYIENYFAYDNKFFDVNEFTTAKYYADLGIFKVEEDSKPRLDRKQCSRFLDYELAVTIFSAMDDIQITKIFGRINASGKQLSDQERRQAGVINSFSDMVRKIASEIRGDASKEILTLSEMPEISIETARAKQNYGLKAEEIFWYKQGILSASQLRNSQDEEMVADILASILLKGPFERSKEEFNKLYDEETDLYKKVNDALLSYPQQKIYEEIKQTFSVLKEVIEAYDDSPNTLRNIVNLESRNPVKHPFYSIFMAFFELLVWEDKSPADAKQIMHSLRGLQSGMTSTAKYTKTGDRKRNIKITKGLIEDYFVHEEPSLLKHGPGLAIDFENSLMRSRTETPRYEFKQGLLDLYEDRKLNKDLIDRIINTACGMANLGPDCDGFIYIGVADKKSDADRIKQLYGRDYIEVKGHYVVGVDREMKYLNLKDEAYIRKITEQINTSKLSEPLKSQILAHIDTVTYRGYVIVRLLVPSQKEISFVGEIAYLRQNSDTKEAKAPQISGIIESFRTRNV